MTQPNGRNGASGISAQDEALMMRALELARRGYGYVNPNPLVGCVLVKDGAIIGEGFHSAFGHDHAEVSAVKDCLSRGDTPEGACAYVTLEPCSHYGKTPPCADMLIEKGVSRVVMGTLDPNPEVCGRGARRLEDAGIEVSIGACAEECRRLNDAFFCFMVRKRPLVIAKYAMTLDGKIATRAGASKWITGNEARRHAHLQRSKYAAIMVGSGTVRADDPTLNVRLEGGPHHDPIRIICDTELSIPPSANVIASAKEQATYVATCSDDEASKSAIEQAGCKTIQVGRAQDGRIDLRMLIAKLGEMGIDSVICEGGPTLLGSLWDDGLVDKVHAYIAMKVFGGVDAPSPIGGVGCALPSEARCLANVSVQELSGDIFVEGDAIACSPE